jgi:hypothetical protein
MARDARAGRFRGRAALIVIAALTLIPACGSPRAPVATLSCPTATGAAAQDPPQAARCLYRAWQAGDRSMAAVYASLDAVDILFARPWSPPAAAYTGCAPAIDIVDFWKCRFVQQGAGTMVFTVRRSEGGWRVTAVQIPIHDG